MGTQEDKKRWKEESETLKKDLQNRQKEEKLNPVKISFGQQQKKLKKGKQSQGNASDDQRFRDLLGI